MMASIVMPGNRLPPFGAVVQSLSGRDVSVVADSGLAYLSGVSAGEVLNVIWGGKQQCQITVPVNQVRFESISLTCDE